MISRLCSSRFMLDIASIASPIFIPLFPSSRNLTSTLFMISVTTTCAFRKYLRTLSLQDSLILLDRHLPTPEAFPENFGVSFHNGFQSSFWTIVLLILFPFLMFMMLCTLFFMHPACAWPLQQFMWPALPFPVLHTPHFQSQLHWYLQCPPPWFQIVQFTPKLVWSSRTLRTILSPFLGLIRHLR